MDGSADELLNEMSKITGVKPAVRSVPRIPLTKNPFDDLIVDSANRHGVDPDLIRAQMNQESSFKPNARSNKGASGLMQLMPGTAARFGVTDIYDPKQNIEAGTKYTKWLLDRYKGDVDKALAGYNAGEGNVDKYGGIPPFRETQEYVKRIRSNYKGSGYLNQPRQIYDTSGAESLLNEMQTVTGKLPPQTTGAENLLSEMRQTTGVNQTDTPQSGLIINAPLDNNQQTPGNDGKIYDKQGNLVTAAGGVDTESNFNPNTVTADYDNYYSGAIKNNQTPVSFQDWLKTRTATTTPDIVQNPQTPTQSVQTPEIAPQTVPQQENPVTTPQVTIPQPKDPVTTQPVDRTQPTTPVQPQVQPQKPAYSEADFRAYLRFKNLPNTAGNRATFEKDLEANAQFGQVEAAANVNAPNAPQQQQTVPTQPVSTEIPETAYQKLPNVSDKQAIVKPNDRTEGKSAKIADADILRTQAGKVGIDLRQKPKGMSWKEFFDRTSLKALQSEYGYTDQQINDYVASGKSNWGGRLDYTDEEAAQIMDRLTAKNKPFALTVERIAIADVMGDTAKIKQVYEEQQKKADEELAMQQAMERGKMDKPFTTDSLQNPDLSPLEKNKLRDGASPFLPLKTVKEANGVERTSVDMDEVRKQAIADLTRENSGFFGKDTEPSEDDINGKVASILASGLNPQEQRNFKEITTNLKTNYGYFGTALGGIFGGGGRTLDWLNGITKSQTGNTNNLMSKIANIAKAVEKETQVLDAKGNPTFTSGVVSMFASAPSDLSRFGVQSAMPGGKYIVFPMDSYFQSIGRGDNPDTTFKDVIKSGAMQLMFSGGGLLGAKAKEGALNAFLGKADIIKLANGTASLSQKANSLLYLYGRGTTLATITGGTTALSLAEGNSLNDSIVSGLQMGLFDGVLHGNKDLSVLSGKVFKIIDGQKVIPFTIIPKGKDYEIVQLAKMPETADAIISDKAYPKFDKGIQYNDDGSVKVQGTQTLKPLNETPNAPEPRAPRKNENLTDKKVINSDGLQGTVKTDNQTGNGVIVEWEDGKTSEVNRKKLLVGEIEAKTENQPAAEADVQAKPEDVQKEAETPVNTAKPDVQATVDPTETKVKEDDKDNQGKVDKVEEQQPKYKVQTPTKPELYVSAPNSDGSFNAKYALPSPKEGATIFALERESGNRFKVFINPSKSSELLAKSYPDKTLDPVFENFSNIKYNRNAKITTVKPAIVELNGDRYTLVEKGAFDLDGTGLERENIRLSQGKVDTKLQVDSRVINDVTGVRGRISDIDNKGIVTVKLDNGKESTFKQDELSKLENRTETVKDFEELAKNSKTFAEFADKVNDDEGLRDRKEELKLDNLAELYDRVNPKAEPQNSENSDIKQGRYDSVEKVVKEKEPTGENTRTVTTERGTKVKFTPKVIEAADILTSLDEGYPQEYQPRDRSRKASKTQIAEIANKLNPEFLDDSPKASDGRPLVVPIEVDGKTKYAVISGNARSEAIRRAYRKGSNASQKYAEFTQGKETNALREPVYVGVLDPNEVDLKSFAREANESNIAAKSATEQAKIDAGFLDTDLMSKFVPSEDGGVTSAANRDFVRSFMKKVVPESERGEAMQADGKLSKAGADRITNAIFAKAFGERSIERIAESTDSNVRRITNALLQLAGKFAALKQGVADGIRHDGLDITDNIVNAVEKLSFLRDEGVSVQEYLQQQGLYGEDLTPFEKRILTEFDNYKNSARAVSGILDKYLDFANELGDPHEVNLFGEPVEANAPTLFREAVLEYEKENKIEKTEERGVLGEDTGGKVQPETGGASETTDAGNSQKTESVADRRLSAGNGDVASVETEQSDGALKSANIPTGDEIKDFVNDAIDNPQHGKRSISLGEVSTENAEMVKNQTGLDINGFERVIDNYSAKHIIKLHGDPKREELRGQVAVTADDFALIQKIVENPDKIENAGKTGPGRDTILYIKRFNGDTYYYEEIRTKKSELVPVTIFKRKTSASPTSNVQNVFESKSQRVSAETDVQDNLTTSGDKNKPLLNADNFDKSFEKILGSDALTQAKEATKSALTETGKGLSEATKALGKLFDPDKFKGGGFPAFDEKTYAAAKPHFEEALKHFKEAGKEFKSAVEALISHLKESGLSPEAIYRMKPYIEKFAEEQNNPETLKPPTVESLSKEAAVLTDPQTEKNGNQAVKSVTSIKNEIVDAEREKRALPPLMKPLTREWGTAAADALAKMDRDASYQDNLLDELRDKPRATTDTENFTILHRKVALRNDFERIATDLTKAFEAGDEGAVAELNLQAARVSDALLDIDNISRKTGTEAGRGLNARKMMLAEDYSLAALELKKRTALGGRQLDEAERAELQKTADEFKKRNEELEAHLKTREDELAQIRATKELDPIILDIHGYSPLLIRAAERVVATLDSRAVAARKRLERRGYTFNAGINPQDLIDLTEIGISHLASAGLDFAKWSGRMIGEFGDAIKPHLDEIFTRAQKDFDKVVPDRAIREKITKAESKVPDKKGAIIEKLENKRDEQDDDISGLVRVLAREFVAEGEKTRDGLIDKVHKVLQELDPETTRREAMDAISGYGKYKQHTKNEISETLADLSGQMRSISKLEDMAKGQAPARIGVERRAPSVEEQKLLEQVAEAKKKGNFNVTDPATALRTALKSTKTRLLSSIGDLTDAINNNAEISKTKKTSPTSPEIEALKQKRDELKTQYDEIFGGGEMSDEKRLELATKAVESSIKDLEERIKNDDFSDRKTRPAPESAAFDLLKAKRDALRAQYDELRELAHPERAAGIALKAWKTRTLSRIAELQTKLANADFAPREKRPPLDLDTEGRALKAGIEKLKKDFETELQKDRLKNRTLLEKSLDTLTKWRRGFILSSPITLAKLSTAAFERMVFAPTEELIGKPFAWVFRGVGQKTEREGGINIKAEARAIADGFTVGMRDAWSTLKTGHSELSLLFGKGDVSDHSVMDYFGYMHGALKAPVKRSEFSRSFTKRTEKAIAAGIDVTDPMVQTRISVEAYQDANRAIFMQDNRVVNAFKRAVNALEEPDKQTGKVSIPGKLAATGARILLPIVKIPTNVVAETSQYAVGLVTGSVKLGLAYRRGIENLQPAEADIIMRHLQKGLIGASFMLLGYFNPNTFGGYYQPGGKRDDKDVKFGGVKLFGVELPSYVVHNPLLEVLQLGATIRRVADSKMKKSDKESKGITQGVIAGGLGLAEEIPFVKETTEIAKAFDGRTRADFAGEFVKSLVVPQAVSWLATRTDKKTMSFLDLLGGETIKRKPESVWEHIETGVPFLRQRVPVKKDKK